MHAIKIIQNIRPCTDASSGRHLLTFDIEHWDESLRLRGIDGSHGVLFDDSVIVNKILEALSQYNQSATFFVTGRFANSYPEIVRRCSALGHEIASHSFNHKVIGGDTSLAAFREDLRASIQTLQDLTGKKVVGYRAPKWSITKDNVAWVLEVLSEEGLVYDSSFSPKILCWQDIESSESFVCRLKSGRTLLEIPPTPLNILGYMLPAGGLYFRLLPEQMLSVMFMQRVDRRCKAMLYLHPHDLNPAPPALHLGGALIRLFRIAGVRGSWGKFLSVLGSYQFSSIERILSELTASNAQ